MLSRISNYDIMIDDLDLLFNEEKADCLYSDPPWGSGNLKYWRTINNQVNYEVDWKKFLERILFLYKKHCKNKAPLFLETGLRFKEDLIHVFGKPNYIFTCVYGSKKNKNLLLCWNVKINESLENKTSVNLVYSALKQTKLFENSIIFDPCVGLGNTIKACKKLNYICYANELNKNRMLCSKKIMEFIEI